MKFHSHVLALFVLLTAGAMFLAPIGCGSAPQNGNGTGNVVRNADGAFSELNGGRSNSGGSGTVNNAGGAFNDFNGGLNERSNNSGSNRTNNAPTNQNNGSSTNNGGGNGNDAADVGSISLQQARDNWPNNTDPRYKTSEWLLGYGSATGTSAAALEQAKGGARNDIAAVFQVHIKSTLNTYEEELIREAGGDTTRTGFSQFSFNVNVFVNETISGTEILDTKADTDRNMSMALAGLNRRVFAENLRDKIHEAIGRVESGVSQGDTLRTRGDLLRALTHYRSALDDIVKIRIWMEQYRIIRYTVNMRESQFTTSDLYALMHACQQNVTVVVACKVEFVDEQGNVTEQSTLARGVSGQVAGAMGNTTIRVVNGSTDFQSTPLETLERLGVDDLRALINNDEVNYVLMGMMTVRYSSTSRDIHFYKGSYSFTIFSLGSGGMDGSFNQGEANLTEASHRTHSTAQRAAFDKTINALSREIRSRFGNS